ncbi:hypothetical protein [Agrobacterium sp. S7/73]|uniref:hypothetical protein n=2 Tax=unclassified Agrobacterium TaxID=2632611 RepID=UPI001C5BEF97|nr:hypothetical protein [Agrobacterium sp. S7/73]
MARLMTCCRGTTGNSHVLRRLQSALNRHWVTMFNSYGAMKAGGAGAMAAYFKAHVVFFLLVACVAQSTATALAQIAEFDERRIQAAVMLDGLAEPIVGEANCRVDSKCEIIFGSGSGVKVDVTLRRRGAIKSADLTIQCPKGCSFTSGRSKITFQGERKFDLFRGAENDVEIRPVVMPRIKIGRIFLIVE